MTIDALINDDRPQRKRITGAAPVATGYAGIILDNPEDVNNAVRVRIPSFSTLHAFGPCPWMPRDGEFPSKDDPCLVILDDQENPWIVAWWPA